MTTVTSTRLHITPFSANLLPIVLGSNLVKSAENISFHSIDTFPENDYGFVDLPEVEARNLISKLNGAILKGKKMKIEKARSKKRSHEVVQEQDVSVPDVPQKKAKRSTKPTEDGVLHGHQLPAHRKVKRGWTEPKIEEPVTSRSKDKRTKKEKKSKRQTPSQYTDKDELLFRTKLPPNKEHLDTTTKSKSEKKKKVRGETVVHEFQHTEVQPAFVRDTASSGRVAEYNDHVGWVDDEGQVIEQESASVARKRLHTAERSKLALLDGAKISAQQLDSSEAAPIDESSDSASSDDPVDTNLENDDTSSAGVSPPTSGAGSSSESDEAQDAGDFPMATRPADPETPPKVHPLEALFKRPKAPTGTEATKPSLEIETSFSFFDPSTVDNEDELPPLPATPFTSHDMRSREVRSAAPTPDTAHPSRFTSFASALAAGPPRGQPQDEVTPEPAGDDDTVTATGPPGERTESDFEKRFWAERGQNNRAWKARRKTALKEQRQKDNRVRRPRNW